MVLSAHQPAYLPWLGLIDKIAQADTFVSFNTVQYLPKEFQNRNRILNQHGPIWLTVPVLKKGHRDKPLNRIEINNTLPWRRQHWNAIRHNYHRAPYFDLYAEPLKAIYDLEWPTLSILNEWVLRWLLAELGVKTRMLYASSYSFRGTKSELVLDMCRQLGADTYIFGALGRDYADVAAFEQAGVEVRFQEYVHPVYRQWRGGEFVSHLSVLDLLLNCGPDSLDILCNCAKVAAA